MFNHMTLMSWEWWRNKILGLELNEEQRVLKLYKFIVFNWNHFEMRLHNLRINFFLFIAHSFVLILVVFVLFLLSLCFGQISPNLQVYSVEIQHGQLWIILLLVANASICWCYTVSYGCWFSTDDTKKVCWRLTKILWMICKNLKTDDDLPTKTKTHPISFYT